jgi:hypothetical protein
MGLRFSANANPSIAHNSKRIADCKTMVAAIRSIAVVAMPPPCVPERPANVQK